MSPKASPDPSASRSSSSSPRPARRPSGQPKSTRQQYSACGACRMRRVRCDLKDLPVSATGQHPPCSNCSERGLKCVDEFAEVKAVKLLRRGRRLQQVEAVYGQNSGDESSLHSVVPPRSIIPRLRPEFFSSPFFHRFHIQRPILEPVEFCNRYYDYCNKGNKEHLQAPGQLIALILVVWAASFGVNEYGVEELCDGSMNMRRRRDRVNEMVHEVLYLIDIHGILRKPTWDGVRALLLILPLTQNVQTPPERLAMYEATMSQVYTLCSLTPSTSINSGHGEYIDAIVRARIFWYAHVLDGVTTGLRGGRIMLTDDDLSAFEATLPPLGDNTGSSSLYAITYRYATIPIRIASVCRQVHASLTGPRARRGHEINEDKLHDAWETLDQCWKDFEGLRQLGTDGFVQAEDVDRYIDAWQIFVFECHNVIREALKQRLVSRPAPDSSFLPDGHPSSSHSRDYEIVARLHSKASVKCQGTLRHIVAILRRNLGTHFFQFDAALIRDGCFFAGYLHASESGSSEDVETCLQALRELRWTFAKSEDREQTVRMVWESRMGQARSRSFSSSPTDDLMHSFSPYVRRPLVRPISVPPLSLSLCTVPGTLDPASAPSTACSSNSDWPATATTPPTSSGTGMYEGSVHRGSPTSPFAHSPHHALSMDPSHQKAPLVDSPPLLLDTAGHAARPGDSGLDSVFYWQTYDYSGSGQSGAHHVPAQSVLSTSSGSDYPAPAVFDASTVVFSVPPASTQGAMDGLTASAAVNGDSQAFGTSSFYQ